MDCWQHMTHLMQGQCAAAPVHHVGVSDGFYAQVQWIEEAPTRRVAQRERSPGKKEKTFYAHVSSLAAR